MNRKTGLPLFQCVPENDMWSHAVDYTLNNDAPIGEVRLMGGVFLDAAGAATVSAGVRSPRRRRQIGWGARRRDG